MNLTLGSVGGFLPTIIKGLGKSNADVSVARLRLNGSCPPWLTLVKAQLFTVPPYVVALVVMLLLTTFSDWRQARGIPVACIFIIGVIGWAVLLTIPAANITSTQFSARYFACCLIVTAGYTNIPLIIGEQRCSQRASHHSRISLASG